MRSGSVRSCPRQLPPHLEMTLVYCSRDFSTLRSLYPRQYWSLTTEGGAARDSYECKYICCCVILVLLCLLLSPVFGVSLSSVSFLHRSSFVFFIFSLFVVSGLLAGSLCVLLRIRACTCAVNFMLNFVSCLLDSNFIFRFVVVHSSQVHLVWLYDHHLRRVLVASNRPPFVLIRSYIWIQAALLRIAAPAKLSHVILRALPRFRYFPHAIPGVWSATIINHDYTPIIMRAQLRTYSLLNSLIHLLLSSLCSQSATCSFLFRVILLLAVVN